MERHRTDSPCSFLPFLNLFSPSTVSIFSCRNEFRQCARGQYIDADWSIREPGNVERHDPERERERNVFRDRRNGASFDVVSRAKRQLQYEFCSAVGRNRGRNLLDRHEARVRRHQVELRSDPDDHRANGGLVRSLAQRIEQGNVFVELGRAVPRADGEGWWS